MGYKGRKEETEAKQHAFVAALNFIFATTEDNKVAKVARSIAGIAEDDSEGQNSEYFRRILNQLYSITNSRSTPPDYLAQLLYDTYPSPGLREILSESFAISSEQPHRLEGGNSELPIEEELPELILARVRELKSSHENMKKLIAGLESERKELMKLLEESLEKPDQRESLLAEIIKMLRETGLVF